jgi:predicted nucleic acid-binding protein
MAKSRVYLDSACFIDLANVEVNKPLAEPRKKNLWFVKNILEAHRNGDVTAYTSTLTIAECTHASGDVSESVKSLFRKLLTSGQYVQLVQPDPFVCEDARDLRWKHGIALSGADAVHVASALYMKCDELITFDGKAKDAFTYKATLAGLKLRVIEPSDSTSIPDTYRQEEMFPVERKKAPQPSRGTRKPAVKRKARGGARSRGSR